MTTAEAPVNPNELPFDERQRILVEASEKYMSGLISLKEFRRVERTYGPDYNAATLELAKTQGGLLRFLERLISMRHQR